MTTSTTTKPDGLILLADSAMGVYVPKHFADIAADTWEGFDPKDRAILKEGPEHEQYWDAWTDVLDNTKITTETGYTYGLWQDGDLWAVCDELITDEEYKNFYGEERVCLS